MLNKQKDKNCDIVDIILLPIPPIDLNLDNIISIFQNLTNANLSKFDMNVEKYQSSFKSITKMNVAIYIVKF